MFLSIYYSLGAHFPFFFCAYWLERDDIGRAREDDYDEKKK